jgi:hypothetical protein
MARSPQWCFVGRTAAAGKALVTGSALRVMGMAHRAQVGRIEPPLGMVANVGNVVDVGGREVAALDHAARMIGQMSRAQLLPLGIVATIRRAGPQGLALAISHGVGTLGSTMACWSVLRQTARHAISSDEGVHCEETERDR